MGMYDSVWAACPKCDETVEFQTKVGACTLADYHLPCDVATEIAVELNGRSELCARGHTVTIRISGPTPPETVPMDVCD